MEKSVTKVGGNTKKTEKRRKKKDFYFRRLFRDIKKNPTLYVMSLPAFKSSYRFQKSCALG